LIREEQFTQNQSQICAYSDDIVVITRFREKIIEIYNKIEEKAGKIGLEVCMYVCMYVQGWAKDWP
jgi:D-mannonate dehydratase